MDLFVNSDDSTAASRTFTLCGATYNTVDTCISVAACVVGFGLAILLACYIVPRSPPPRTDLGVTAREYEALENEYAWRNFWLDILMLVSLGIMTIGGFTLSMIHVYLYMNGLVVYRQSVGRLSRSSSERVGLVQTDSTMNYGGLTSQSNQQDQ